MARSRENLGMLRFLLLIPTPILDSFGADPGPGSDSGIEQNVQRAWLIAKSLARVRAIENLKWLQLQLWSRLQGRTYPSLAQDFSYGQNVWLGVTTTPGKCSGTE